MNRQMRVAHVVALVVIGVSLLAAPALADCPELVGQWQGGPASDVTVSGDYAFVGSGSALVIVDVSDPSAAWQVGAVSFGDDVGDLDFDIAIDGNYAYVVEGDSLHVIDVSVPSAPVEVGSIIEGYGDGYWCSFRWDSTVAVEGGYVYALEDCSYGGEVHGETGVLHIVDVHTPFAPVEVGTIDVGGAGSVVVSNGYAYVAETGCACGGASGMCSCAYNFQVFDLSEPSAPVGVGGLELGHGWISPLCVCSYAHDLAFSDGYAYVAERSYAGGSALRVIDVSDPTAPVQVGFVETPGEAHGVAVSDGYAYVADGGSGLRVFDVSAPSAPIEVGSYDTPGTAWDVAVAGAYAYVADWDAGLEILLSCAALFSDGFESGDTSAWSAWVPCGIALDFLGDDDYVELPNEFHFDFSTAVTVEAWIWVRAFDKGHQAIVTKGDDSWRLQRLLALDTIEFTCDTSTGQHTLFGAIPVNDGRWHHAAGVFDSVAGTMALYIDGALDQLDVASGTINDTWEAALIGGNSSFPIADRSWNGRIDEVRIWNFARSQKEILDTMRASLTGDESGLVAYYQFDEGVPGGDNSNPPVDTLPDVTGYGNNGLLHDFALVGDASNWVCSPVGSPR